MTILLSPHNDDAVLFASFLSMRHHATIVTVFDSHVQARRGNAGCDAATRRAEDQAAAVELGLGIKFAGFRDDEGSVTSEQIADWVAMECGICDVIAPAYETGGHRQHNLVAVAGRILQDWGASLIRYTTYTRDGGGRTIGNEVRPDPWMITRKLRAMACYKSQIEIASLGCWPWFMELREYTA